MLLKHKYEKLLEVTNNYKRNLHNIIYDIDSRLHPIEEEMGTFGEKYANANHNHDDRYSQLNHNHDSQYSEKDHTHEEYLTSTDTIDNALHLNNKSDTDFASATHNHDERYSQLNHEHNDLYSPLTHNHDDEYSPLNHNHDENYAQLNHNHDERYSQLNHNHNDLYSSINHTHDEYSLKNHTHNDYLKTIPIKVGTEQGMISVPVTENINIDTLNLPDGFTLNSSDNGYLHLSYNIPTEQVGKTVLLSYSDKQTINGEYVSIDVPETEENNVKITATITDNDGNPVEDGTVNIDIIPITTQEYEEPVPEQP